MCVCFFFKTSSLYCLKILQETALVEAFNLKAAIEYSMKSVYGGSITENLDAAKEALSDMPPRSEEELDPVTLHNLVS